MAHNRQFGTREQRVEEGNSTLMEQKNDAKWAELGDQVSLLKSLSMDIKSEVNSQNSLLDNMGTGFGQASELFGKTLLKMGEMINAPGGSHMYYLIGFVVFFFLVLYFTMGRK